MRKVLLAVLVGSFFLASQASAQPQPGSPPPTAPPPPPPWTGSQPGTAPAPAPAPTSPYPPAANAPPAGQQPSPYAPAGQQPQTYGPPPQMQVEQPPPPPPQDTTAQRHDSFYFRIGTGPANGRVVTEAQDSPVSIKGTYTGWGPSYELMLGGTLGSGFVLGGGFLGQDISSPKVELDMGGGLITATDIAEDKALGVVLIGPFLDWFPDDRGGLHFGLMLGGGAIGLSNDNDAAATGGGGALWGGYDFWIADQWSLGGELRALAVSTKREFKGTKFDDRASSIEILFTALYH